VLITLLSVQFLFLEMLLIRWISTEVRVLAYLQNSVLVACFLGLGLGSRNSREPARMLPAMLSLLLLTFVIEDPLSWHVGEALTQGMAAFQDTVVWQNTGQFGPGYEYLKVALVGFSLFATLILLSAVVVAFAPFGQLLGRWMDECPRPIAAYSANILGSLIGIALFDVLTVGGTPPLVWLCIASAGTAGFVLLGDDKKLIKGVAVVVALALPVLPYTQQPDTRTLWSPYQKLSVSKLMVRSDLAKKDIECGTTVRVNDVGYMVMIDVSPTAESGPRDLFDPEMIPKSHYTMPYRLIGQRDDVLVVGSGAGNDVAATLAAGAKHVDAVEIDPTIVALGTELHPNKPYSDPKVTLTVDDARAFFRRDTGPYDLVWFGLLDSHTNPSAYTNVRLDHFVYTKESFADVKGLLKDDGIVVLFFEPIRPWIVDRLALGLRDTFGTDPLGFRVPMMNQCLGWGGMMMIAGSEAALAKIEQRVAENRDLGNEVTLMSDWEYDSWPITDDWPYLYLEYPSIPSFYLLVAVCCALLGLGLRRRLFQPGEDVNAPMMLLGCGFMLLEVAGVSRAALLFGSTWTVSAYIVGAILAMILLANLTASLKQFDPWRWPLWGLIATILALAFVPIAWLAALPVAARIVIGAAFFSVPVYFSGLIFVHLWAAAERKDLALGSNILGSLVGGIASTLSMIVGFLGITMMTLGVYLLAFLVARKRELG